MSAANKTFATGKVIWITGASSGIGEELAKQFARDKATLILSSRRKEERSIGKTSILLL